MSLGSDIAKEISNALAEASAAVGNGELIGVLNSIGAVDDSTYPPTPRAASNHPVRCVQVQHSQADAAGGVGVSDLKIMCAVPPVAPKTGDRFTVLGRTFGVKDVQPSAPGGVPLFYYLYLEGS